MYMHRPLCVVSKHTRPVVHSHTHTHTPVQVDGGVLQEGLISVGSKKAEEPDPLDPEIIKRFDNRFLYRP